MLGLIWSDGPMTAYAVRSTFARSPTSYFSGSAGAIYPLVERLRARGLLRVRARREDGRASRALSLTDAGLKALRVWLRPPVEPWMASVTRDPIRTRILFAGALTAAQRRRLLEEAEPALEAEVAKLEARRRTDRRNGPRELYIATTGALAVARARLRWVRWAKKQGGWG